MKHSFQPIRLRTDGSDIVVEMDFGIPNADGETYAEIIREKIVSGYVIGEISHEVLEAGIERAKERHYNG